MTAVYYSFCALSVLCAWLAEKKNSKILFAISAILIAVIAGGSAQTVGIDTEVYYTYIDWAEKDRGKDKFGVWRRKRQLTPVFLPGESYGQRSLAGYSPWGHK